MNKLLLIASAALLCLSFNNSQAVVVSGVVQCDVNHNLTNDVGDIGVPGVLVVITNILPGGAFSNATVTDANGFFSLTIPDFDPVLARLDPLAQIYVESLAPQTLPPDSTILFPPPSFLPPNPQPVIVYILQFDAAGNLQFLVPGTNLPSLFTNGNWLITSPSCQPSSACGLNGGGTIAQRKHNSHTFGGHVSPVASNDEFRQGEWNHIAHDLKLHFHSTIIENVTCGNTSDDSSFDVIEFSGLGILKGTGGKKTAHNGVHFIVRAEDHGRPGRGADRYYIRVFSDNGATLLLVSGDPAHPENIVTVPITSGNLTVRSAP